MNKHIILQNIDYLFNLAKNTFRCNPTLAQRYVNIARKIAMRKRIHLSKEHHILICRHCKSFILGGANSRIRLHNKREPHLTITCLVCNKCTRIILRKKGK